MSTTEAFTGSLDNRDDCERLEKWMRREPIRKPFFGLDTAMREWDFRVIGDWCYLSEDGFRYIYDLCQSHGATTQEGYIPHSEGLN